jgi:hypothetical protein
VAEKDRELRYEVRWIDSGLSIHGWNSLEEISQKKIATVETVGYLVFEDEDSIYLALTRHKEENAYYGVQVIWRKSIVSMERLRER